VRGAAIIYYSRRDDIYGNDRGEIAAEDSGNIYYNIYSLEVFFQANSHWQTLSAGV